MSERVNRSLVDLSLARSWGEDSPSGYLSAEGQIAEISSGLPLGVTATNGGRVPAAV